MLLDNEKDEPGDALVPSYLPHADAHGGVSGGGKLDRRGRHLACFLVPLGDTEYAFPGDAHPQSWLPLETILSDWVGLKQVLLRASPATTVSATSARALYPARRRAQCSLGMILLL